MTQIRPVSAYSGMFLGVEFYSCGLKINLYFSIVGGYKSNLFLLCNTHRVTRDASSKIAWREILRLAKNEHFYTGLLASMNVINRHVLVTQRQKRGRELASEEFLKYAETKIRTARLRLK